MVSKSWVFRFAVNRHAHYMGLGSLSGVSLSEARQLAAECRRRRQQGIDPIEHRRGERQASKEKVVTFRRAFETFHTLKRQSLSNAKHRAQWQSTMQTYVFPTTVSGTDLCRSHKRPDFALLTCVGFKR
jgi:hypothetical protein